MEIPNFKSCPLLGYLFIFNQHFYYCSQLTSIKISKLSQVSFCICYHQCTYRHLFGIIRFQLIFTLQQGKYIQMCGYPKTSRALYVVGISVFDYSADYSVQHYTHLQTNCTQLRTSGRAVPVPAGTAPSSVFFKILNITLIGVTWTWRYYAYYCRTPMLLQWIRLDQCS